MEGNERKIQKTNVGAGLCTRPQTGITLIALIITIIVMLILVGVTINVVLNGGLFTQAQTAASETQKEAEKEQLLSAVVAAIGTDAKVNFSKLDSNLPNGWTGSNGTYTSPKGNVFTVDEKGTITGGNESGGENEKPGDEDEVTDENLGKYVTYKGITWIVLYDDKDKVELISADALGSVTLGGSTFDDGKESYNNLIATLTQACKNETGITTGIRNVGGPEEDPETSTYVTLAELKTKGFVPQTDKETEIESLIDGIKQEDENYLADYNQMQKLGILNGTNEKTYWLASRSVLVTSSGVYYGARCYRGYYDGDYYDLCYVADFGLELGYSDTAAVRPVISLNSGILNGNSGEGTRTNPIKLDE